MAYDESAKKATLKYLAKQKELRLWVTKEEHERYSAYASGENMSLRQFCKQALEEKITAIDARNGVNNPASDVEKEN